MLIPATGSALIKAATSAPTGVVDIIRIVQLSPEFKKVKHIKKSTLARLLTSLICASVSEMKATALAIVNRCAPKSVVECVQGTVFDNRSMLAGVESNASIYRVRRGPIPDSTLVARSFDSTARMIGG